MIAMLALDLPTGATIACPDYGLPACQNAARLLGYNVVLVDVRPETGCMDDGALMKVIQQVSAVVFVDHNGHTGEDLKHVYRTCAAYKVPLIEDAAVALGCPGAGVTGDISILSFSVPKIITTGQGGAVLTKRPDLYERLLQLVDQGGGDWRADRLHRAVGGNFRMTDLQAALGVAQMDDLRGLLETRERMHGWYDSAGKDNRNISALWIDYGWMVCVRARDAEHADRIIAVLNAAGFDAKRLYRPVHRNPPYAADDALFPGACEFYDRTVYLPSSLTLKKEQATQIAKLVVAA
jgi:perosamine synthetase